MTGSAPHEPLRVLFLCTHNSARSQMAEALLARRGGERFRVASAGTEPSAEVHPLARKALRRAGTDWMGGRPKSVDAVAEEGRWDVVITVCDKAREACPRLPGHAVTAHWGIPDPAEARGDEQAREAAFWNALRTLARRIDLLCALPDEKLRGLALKSAVREIGAAEHEAGTDEM